MMNLIRLLFASAAFLTIWSVAQAQPVQLNGWLLAEKSCPATKKKGRDNPGNVHLDAGRHYKMKGRNATPGTHYRIVVPGAPGPDERWVAMSCGTHVLRKGQGQKRTEPKKTVERNQPSRPKQARVQGLKADSLEHILAVSWQPGFCATKPEKSECRTLTRNRPDADRFSLHGLWPDDLDDRSIFPCFCHTGQARSCGLRLRPLKSVDMSRSVLDRLRTAMPGSRSGLHIYQWGKHGTCYEQDRDGSDPDEYFGEMMALLDQVNASGVKTLFRNNLGRTITARQVSAAFDNSFGRGAGDRVIMRCAKVSGREVITELWIGLGADLNEASDLANRILAAPPAREFSSARRCRSGLVVRAN